MYLDQFEAQASIGFFVNFFEAQAFLKGDSSRIGGSDETEVLYEEDAGLEDCFVLNAIQFAGEELRKWIAEIPGQSRGADDGTVVELHFSGKARSLVLTLFLHSDDCVDERGIRPWFGDAAGLGRGDDVGGSFFNYGEPLALELADDGCLARTRGPGEDESFQMTSLRGEFLRST